jgi:hypothetical protein
LYLKNSLKRQKGGTFFKYQGLEKHPWLLIALAFLSRYLSCFTQTTYQSQQPIPPSSLFQYRVKDA